MRTGLLVLMLLSNFVSPILASADQDRQDGERESPNHFVPPPIEIPTSSMSLPKPPQWLRSAVGGCVDYAHAVFSPMGPHVMRASDTASEWARDFMTRASATARDCLEYSQERLSDAALNLKNYAADAITWARERASPIAATASDHAARGWASVCDMFDKGRARVADLDVPGVAKGWGDRASHHLHRATTAAKETADSILLSCEGVCAMRETWRLGLRAP